MLELIAEAEPVASALPAEVYGDVTLGGDGLRMPVDAHCPGCGWPERFYDTTPRRFGCIKCPYTSDERNA